MGSAGVQDWGEAACSKHGCIKGRAIGGVRVYTDVGDPRYACRGGHWRAIGGLPARGSSYVGAAHEHQSLSDREEVVKIDVVAHKTRVSTDTYVTK